jgi:hypothetical protein
MLRRVVLAFSFSATAIAGSLALAREPRGEQIEPDLAAISERITRSANWRRYDAQGNPIPQIVFRPGERVQAHGRGVDEPPAGAPRRDGSTEGGARRGTH